jgi:hypothetical protein
MSAPDTRGILPFSAQRPAHPAQRTDAAMLARASGARQVGERTRRAMRQRAVPGRLSVSTLESATCPTKPNPLDAGFQFAQAVDAAHGTPAEIMALSNAQRAHALSLCQQITQKVETAMLVLHRKMLAVQDVLVEGLVDDGRLDIQERAELALLLADARDLIDAAYCAATQPTGGEPPRGAA